MSKNTESNEPLYSRVTLCGDGVYRWVYEYPLLKNPTILYTVWKVMGLAALLPALIILLGNIGSEGKQAIKVGLIVFAITVGILAVLSVLAYLLLSAMYGGKYVVLFEMNEETITHAQMPKQVKMAEALGWLTTMMGVKAGDPATIGMGLLASSRSMVVSEFSEVTKVIGIRKRNTIKVNQMFLKNQVYVCPEDYDFVWNYISERAILALIR